MAGVFRALCDEAQARGGPCGVLGIWPAALADWAGAMVGEYLTSSSRGTSAAPPGSVACRPALVAGCAGGSLLGLYLVLTNLAVVVLPDETLTTLGVLSLVGALCAGAGLRGARSTGRLATGVRNGATVGLVVGVVMNVALSIMALAFYDVLRRHASADPDYVRSGAPSYAAYLIDDTVGGWLFGTVFLLVTGAGLGVVGGIVGAWRGPAGGQGGERGMA
jgi:hypothetical protein